MEVKLPPLASRIRTVSKDRSDLSVHYGSLTSIPLNHIVILLFVMIRTAVENRPSGMEMVRRSTILHAQANKVS